MRTLALLVVIVSGSAARAEDAPVPRFVALANVFGLLVRGPTSAVPGEAGYNLSLTLGLGVGLARFGIIGALHVGAPKPEPTGAFGLQCSFDVLRLDLDPVHAAVFVGAQSVARVGLPQGEQWVTLGRVGVRVAGLEFAFGIGPEVPVGWPAPAPVTWNLEALSLAFNLPELFRVISHWSPGPHGVLP